VRPQAPYVVHRRCRHTDRCVYQVAANPRITHCVRTGGSCRDSRYGGRTARGGLGTGSAMNGSQHARSAQAPISFGAEARSRP